MTTPPPRPPDERLAAVDKIRDTTRWLILAFAAIGVAVAGTAPLSNIGKLGIHEWRLWVAGAAATAAFGAIAAAIWVATKVWAPATTNLDELVDDPELRGIFAESFELLKGHGTNLDEFKAQYDHARSDYVRALQEQRDHPTAETNAAAAQAKKAFNEFAPAADRIATEGLLATARKRFRRARPIMFASAFAAGLAIVAFAWAANPAGTATQTIAAKARAVEIDIAPTGAGVQIDPATARRLLRAHGFSRSTAGSYVASFRGAIAVQTVQQGSVFYRYATTANSKGRFLTKMRLPGPRLARLALHLPWANTAACLQRVSSKRRTLVLRGAIAQGKPQIEQLLVLDQGAFTFDSGKAYTKIRCPED